jgi:hypothetical protein
VMNELGGVWRQRHRLEGTTGPFLDHLPERRRPSVNYSFLHACTPTCATAPPITTLTIRERV